MAAEDNQVVLNMNLMPRQAYRTQAKSIWLAVEQIMVAVILKEQIMVAAIVLDQHQREITPSGWVTNGCSNSVMVAELRRSCVYNKATIWLWLQ